MYEKYLLPKYSSKIADIYEEKILTDLEFCPNRMVYIDVCYNIWRIMEIGQKPKAAKLIEHLRTKYKNRKALIEELDRL